MNEILEISPYSTRTARIKIHNTSVALRAKPGNFIMIRFSENGARLPFSIVDTDPENGIVEIIIHRAEGLDDILKIIRPGYLLPDLLGPLGRPAVIDSNRNVLCCGDGAGFVPLLPILRGLHENGCKVISIMSEKSDKAACLSDDVENYSDKVLLVKEANLYEIVERTIKENNIEKLWIAGPTVMLKDLANICRQLGVEVDCILNMVMIDGVGLCGTCRVIVGGERRQTCTDGPVFDALQVDFDQLYNRQRLFD